jgi:4-hydroxybenzoate polyprenyltransferase
MVKEFKDVEGDRKAGVRSLPVVLGVEQATKISMVVLVLSYALFWIPYLILDMNLIYPAVIAVVTVYTVWFALDFAKSSKVGQDSTNLYRRTIRAGVLLFVGMMIGTL